MGDIHGHNTRQMNQKRRKPRPKENPKNKRKQKQPLLFCVAVVRTPCKHFHFPSVLFNQFSRRRVRGNEGKKRTPSPSPRPPPQTCLSLSSFICHTPAHAHAAHTSSKGATSHGPLCSRSRVDRSFLRSFPTIIIRPVYIRLDTPPTPQPPPTPCMGAGLDGDVVVGLDLPDALRQHLVPCVCFVGVDVCVCMREFRSTWPHDPHTRSTHIGSLTSNYTSYTNH